MAIPIWPATLPTRPLRDGNKRGPKRGPISTEMEDGPDVMRRQSRILVRKESVAFDLTPTQMAAFETFYETTIGLGVSRFTMPTVDAAGTITNRTVAMIAKPDLPYEAVWQGSTWRLNFDIAVYY